MGDLGTRSLVGVALIAVAFLALSFGGLAFSFLVMAAVLLMMAEWCGLAGIGRRWTLIALVAAAIGGLSGSQLGLNYGAALIAGLALLLALASRRLMLGAGLLYAALPGLILIWLRAQPTGFAFVLWILLVVWATDIFAYFTGRTFGGRKLAPRISPGKTWSGLVGGVVAAAMIGWVVARWYRIDAPFTALGGAMAVAAQLGDLFESWLKRRAGVKDSGRLLPGHGGALDRLDGLVPVALLSGLVVALQWWPL